MVISGLWAMLPDFNKLSTHEAAQAAHDSLAANVFWFHHLLDSLETAYPEVEGTVALIVLFYMALLVSVRRSDELPD